MVSYTINNNSCNSKNKSLLFFGTLINIVECMALKIIHLKILKIKISIIALLKEKGMSLFGESHPVYKNTGII